jgi:hypothetical protein
VLGELFACRKCCDLAYASQQKNLLLRNVSPVARLQTGHSADKASARLLPLLEPTRNDKTLPKFCN